ncbi:hypothetical protein ODZ60_19775, partial [Escherichia coli]|nr:hypothetical protein [Escherichia coli]MCV9288323.1 hypothetical protein [Escherichia coli]
CYGIKIDHAERETTGVEGKAERLTWHKAWTAVSSGFSISYTSREDSLVAATLLTQNLFTHGYVLGKL